jgi:hypothetical protein
MKNKTISAKKNQSKLVKRKRKKLQHILRTNAGEDEVIFFLIEPAFLSFEKLFREW